MMLLQRNFGGLASGTERDSKASSVSAPFSEAHFGIATSWSLKRDSLRSLTTLATLSIGAGLAGRAQAPRGAVSPVVPAPRHVAWDPQ